MKRKNEHPSNTAIVIAMHGMPPKDFPRGDLSEFFTLHGRIQSAPNSLSDTQKTRYTQLHDEMRNWPRTPENDPFHAAAKEISSLLREKLDYPVHVGYNEFCAPSMDEAFASAAAGVPTRILVVTPMLTRGGDHAELDIPAAIKRAQERFPNINFTYCWPFGTHYIASFLAAQVRRFLPKNSTRRSVNPKHKVGVDEKRSS